ncbi:hypothetical protein LXA43DRAFT_1099828 [Ganoderma leucocontextum]|nr:hypothetical protein LXA43DRAFT_1099828 [Ganoderma leucocontextum]
MPILEPPFDETPAGAGANGTPAATAMSTASSAIELTAPDPTTTVFNAVAQAVTAPGPPPRIELLEDYYSFINGVHLRTVVLRIVGRDAVSMISLTPCSDPAAGSLPSNITDSLFGPPLGLAQLPVQQFIRWTCAFEQGEFSIPDALTPGQRQLLVDFARTWEFFARTPFVRRDWDIFARMLRSVARDPWSHSDSATSMVDGGHTQLSALSH